MPKEDTTTASPPSTPADLAGSRIAWGTCPKAVLDQSGRRPWALKGLSVEITATLKRDRDSHWAVMSYPTGITV